MGQRKMKREVLDIVRSKVQMEGVDVEQCKFNGEGWWVGFKQRHPNLTLQTSDALSYS